MACATVTINTPSSIRSSSINKIFNSTIRMVIHVNRYLSHAWWCMESRLLSLSLLSMLSSSSSSSSSSSLLSSSLLSSLLYHYHRYVIIIIIIIINVISLIITVIIIIVIIGENITIYSTPTSNNELVTNGVFKKVRHPIYGGVILSCIGISIISNSIDKGIVSVLLSLVLDRKCDIEEEYLVNRYPYKYSTYIEKTKKLLPGVY